MPTFVSNIRFGNAQAATTKTLSGTVTATAGDYIVLQVAASTDTATLTTPAGWTLLSGPDRVGTSGTTWLLGRVATGSHSVALTFSNLTRCQALASVYSGASSEVMFAKLVETSSATTTTLPTLISAPADAVVHVAWLRRFGGTPAPNVTLPTGYTQGSNERTATGFGSNPELSIEVGWQVASSAGSYGGETASTSSLSVGVNYLVALPPVASTGVTVAGVSALAALSAEPGASLGGSVTIEGAPAVATLRTSTGSLEGDVATVSAAALAWPPEAAFRQAVRSSLAIWYTAEAWFDGVVFAAGLAPTGGTVTDTTRPGVRRSLSVEFADPDGSLFSSLNRPGVQLAVTAHLRFTSRQVITLPMGVFVVDSTSLSVTEGALSVSAPDKWVLIQRARFMRPQASSRGTTVVNQIVSLIRGALGSAEPVNVTATSRATVGALTWEKDRDQAIIDLAKQIGAWVYFDRDGVATIADQPTVGRSADWLIDAGSAGVLTALDRQSSRADARNVVVVTSSAAAKAKFVPQYIWDNDVTSPTFAGPIGVGTTPPSANTAGPFGLVPFFYASPILSTVNEALKAGRSILSRVMGLASQVSLEQVPNPALDAFSVIDVLPPGREPIGVQFVGGGSGVGGGDGFGAGPFGSSPFGGGTGGGGTGGDGIPVVRYRSTQEIERHIADTVTTPLAGGAQRIEGRSTRSEELEESA